MMNRSLPDPYHFPSVMSFANLEPTITNNTNNQNSHLWDSDTQPNFAHTQTYPNPPSNFDPQPPFALPIDPNFPFYPSPVQVIADYNPGVVKRELEGGGMMSIGLNLGHRTYFSSGDGLTVDRLWAARARHQLSPRCQVEGCRADLAGGKHYHRRHKVCEYHSKAGVILVGGMQQRFCQQCSRFHVLAEFDESKRSCRKRLADHNRRRRKPQPQLPSQSTTNSSDKTTPWPNSINTSNKYTTKMTTTATTTTSSGLLEEGNQENQSREILFRKEPTLSLGEFDGGQQIEVCNYQRLLPHSNNSESSSFYHQYRHQALFGSSSNEASQSTSGQAIFEVDFI